MHAKRIFTFVRVSLASRRLSVSAELGMMILNVV